MSNGWPPEDKANDTASLKGALEKNLQSPKLVKFVKNTLKLLKSLLKGLFR